MKIKHTRECVVCDEHPATEIVCFACATDLLRQRIAAEEETAQRKIGWQGWSDREEGLA